MKDRLLSQHNIFPTHTIIRGHLVEAKFVVQDIFFIKETVSEILKCSKQNGFKFDDMLKLRVSPCTYRKD